MSALISLLVVFLGIPLAVVLATPARYLKFYLRWLAMLGLLAIVWPRAVDHSRFAGLDEALEAFFLGAWTFFVVVKIAVVEARRRLQPEADDDTGIPRDAQDGFALVLAALTGLFAAPWSMFLLALAFSAGSPAAFAHGSSSAVLVAAAALLAKSRETNNEMMQTFAEALLGSAIITLVMAAIYLNSHIANLVAGAEAATDGHPYCIQLDTTSSGYRPAAAKLDFSPMMMRARCSQGYCFSHHAVLAIDGKDGLRLMHWSYGRHSFQDGSMGSASAVCIPAQHYAGRLPLF